MTRSRSLALALLLLLPAGCGPAEQAGAADGWVQLPAVPGRPAAAYMTLTGGAEDDRLLAVELPGAGRAELHRSMTDGHMASMTPVAALPVPAGAEVALAPGGYHVMLHDLPASVAPGAPVELRLRFERTGIVTATLPARAAGEGAPAR